MAQLAHPHTLYRFQGNLHCFVSGSKRRSPGGTDCARQERVDDMHTLREQERERELQKYYESILSEKKPGEISGFKQGGVHKHAGEGVFCSKTRCALWQECNAQATLYKSTSRVL